MLACDFRSTSLLHAARDCTIFSFIRYLIFLKWVFELFVRTEKIRLILSSGALSYASEA